MSTDFITDLPPSEGFNAISVWICRLTKIAQFIPCSTTKNAKQLQLFLKTTSLYSMGYGIQSFQTADHSSFHNSGRLSVHCFGSLSHYQQRITRRLMDRLSVLTRYWNNISDATCPTIKTIGHLFYLSQNLPLPILLMLQPRFLPSLLIMVFIQDQTTHFQVLLGPQTFLKTPLPNK